MLLNVILLVIIFILLVILTMVWPPDSPWSPWWRTNEKTAKAICKLSGISKNDVIYDLGCGDGEVLIQAAKIGARGVGIEIDPTRALAARFRLWKNSINNKVVIKRKNFFDEDLSNATVIIVYLVPVTLNKLIPKFKKELKKGTKIVSYRYKMELPIKMQDKENNLYLYYS